VRSFVVVTGDSSVQSIQSIAVATLLVDSVAKKVVPDNPPCTPVMKVLTPAVDVLR
jgi:hypothetical protein